MKKSFLGLRVVIALAEEGMIPQVVAKHTSGNTPWVACLLTGIASIILAWSESFVQLAAISAVSRLTKYLPTCLTVIIFSRK